VVHSSRTRQFLSLLHAAVSGWVEHSALRLSAALAYYSIFSLAPLLIIIVAATGLIFGNAAASGRVAEQIKQLAGEHTAQAVQAVIVASSRKSASLSATFFSLVVFLFGASSAFSELKSALNIIWGVEIKPGRRLLTITRERFISFIMVIGVGFLLVLSLLISAGLAAFDADLGKLLAIPRYVWRGGDILLSFTIMTVLFGMLFKVLPNVVLRWRDVAVGAACTAFLFTIGKFIIGFYLGTSGISSYYGAAGSAIVILLWVYYSACILFFGAEFTKAYVCQFGHGIRPDSRARIAAQLTTSA